MTQVENPTHRARTLRSLVALALFAAPLGAHAAEQVCDASESKITASPEGKWTAQVQERVCSTDRGAAAAITVEVVPKDAPDKAQRIAATAVPRSRDEWPRAIWRSETLLEVWVPNLAHVLEVKPGHEDVRVELKYCADDPEARQRVAQYQRDLKRWMEEVSAWAQERKRDPEGVGPRPKRPEEPRVPRRPCRDSDIS